MPKLVFTTSTNPDAGLKAFVLTDPWIVLKAAGTRQQLNYTGVNNPLRGRELSRSGANNLGSEAFVFYQELMQRGRSEEDFLLYLAAIYNSGLAGEFLEEGGENVMHIPLVSQHLDADTVDTVMLSARRLRDLAWLSVEAERGEPIGEDSAISLAPEEVLKATGFERIAGSGGRFRQKPTWHPGSNTLDLLAVARNDTQIVLDDNVRSLFDQLPP